MAKRDFKVVTVSLDELEKLARAREKDLNEWSLCKLHINGFTGNLEMLFWTTNEKLAKAEAAKRKEILMKRKEELDIEIIKLRNYLELIQVTAPPDTLIPERLDL